MKRLICVLLAVMLTISAAAVSAGAVTYDPVDSYTVSDDTPTCEEAIKACNGDELGEVQHIYFQLPAVVEGNEQNTTWTNKFNSTDLGLDYCQVCVYWWGGVAGSAAQGWPSGKGCTWVGYKTALVDEKNRIYEATVPAAGDTPMMIWNNGVNGGMDPSKEIFNYARQLADANIEGAEPGDVDTLPEGSPNPDNMDKCIAVINYDPDLKVTNPLTGYDNYGFDWYVYYGDGCYGLYPESSENFKSKEESCCNPEHFNEGGKHVGDQNPSDPDFEYVKTGKTTVEIRKYKGTGGDVVIPSFIEDCSVMSVGDDAFSGCTTVTSVTLPNTVNHIGERAFSGCTGLTNIALPAFLTSIGARAFNGCTGLTDVALPDAVTNIADFTFSDCKSLTGVTIPDSVTSIGDYAFSGCTGLTNVTIPDSVTNVGDYAFSNCAGLTKMVLPDSVTGISRSMFHSCTGLTSVTIPDSVTSIGNTAFFNCTSLASVTLPDSVTSIGNYAFNYCIALKNVTIPDSVTDIGSYAFNCCSSLKSAAIPASVRSIGKKALGFTSENGDFEKIDGFTVHGFIGSAAEKYATDNGFAFIALDKPVLLKVQNTAAGVSLAWGSMNVAEKYRVFRKEGSGSWAKLIDTTALSIVDKTAKSGTKYTYTVRCIGKDGKSYTSDYDRTGKSILYLAQPKITKFENVANGIKLTLSKSTGAASYNVYLKNGTSWKKIGSVTANTYTDTKAKSGTTYTYTVRAVSKDGKTLSSYNTTGWKQKFVASPALPTLKNTKSGVQITIKKVAGAEKYRVFRKEGKGKWVKLIDTTKLTVLDKTAKNGKTYTYTVRCISKDGKTYTSAYNATGKSIKCKR